jgi:hypothetical protein
MDLVDEHDVSALEAGEQPHEIPRLVEGRSRGGMELRAQLLRQDPREARLSKARGPAEEDVVRGLIATLRRTQVDPKVGDDARLAHELPEVARAESKFGHPLGGGEIADPIGRWEGPGEGSRVEDVVDRGAIASFIFGWVRVHGTILGPAGPRLHAEPVVFMKRRVESA